MPHLVCKPKCTQKVLKRPGFARFGANLTIFVPKFEINVTGVTHAESDVVIQNVMFWGYGHDKMSCFDDT